MSTRHLDTLLIDFRSGELDATALAHGFRDTAAHWPGLPERYSQVLGQLLMQGEPAVVLIRLGGHSGTVPSAVLAAELPGFLAKLRTGLELQGDQVSPPPPVKESGGAWEDEEEPRERPIKLRLRAVPLLDMLDTAIKQQSDMFWEKA